MLHLGKIKINFPTFLLAQDESRSISLKTDNNNNNSKNNDNSSNDITKVVPSLTDMEFSWTEDH
jgi:hypothetical protein